MKSSRNAVKKVKGHVGVVDIWEIKDSIKKDKGYGKLLIFIQIYVRM